MSWYEDRDALDALNRNTVEQFRANDGKVGGPFKDSTIVLLTTAGVKSGKPRLAPLAFLDVDGKMLIVGSFAGAPVDPQWVRNVRADPRVHVEVGTDSYDAVARELPRVERDEMWAKIVASAPGFGDYQAKTTRVIPLFAITPA
jgi:deazaflavin-dependent oxidoreductase (nitroreductase family)